jgi:hypothetical protein
MKFGRLLSVRDPSRDFAIAYISPPPFLLHPHPHCIFNQCILQTSIALEYSHENHIYSNTDACVHLYFCLKPQRRGG